MSNPQTTKIQIFRVYRVNFVLRRRQRLLLDQRHTALDTAIYWTEYVLRHNGAYHLQAPGRRFRLTIQQIFFDSDLQFEKLLFLFVNSNLQYYGIDVFAIFATIGIAVVLGIKRIWYHDHSKHRKMLNNILQPHKTKINWSIDSKKNRSTFCT